MCRIYSALVFSWFFVVPHTSSRSNDMMPNEERALSSHERSEELEHFFNKSNPFQRYPMESQPERGKSELEDTLSGAPRSHGESQKHNEKAMEQRAEAKMHPYSVRLTVDFAKSGKTINGLRCAGTLIAADWVLTAARCLQRPGHDTTRVTVIAGADLEDAAAQTVSSSVWHVHPDFAPSGLGLPDNDVALVRLPRPLDRTDFARPARLSAEAWVRGRYNGRCSVTTFSADFSRKTLPLEAGKPCVCEPFLRANHGTAPTARLVCARPGGDPGLCHTDSGGGLVCDGELAAVFSFVTNFPDTIERDMCYKEVRVEVDPAGIADVECANRTTLSGFQDTQPYLGWIKTVSGVGEVAEEVKIDTKKNVATPITPRDTSIIFCLLYLWLFELVF